MSEHCDPEMLVYKVYVFRGGIQVALPGHQSPQQHKEDPIPFDARNHVEVFKAARISLANPGSGEVFDRVAGWCADRRYMYKSNLWF